MLLLDNMNTTTQLIGSGLPLIKEFMKFSEVEIEQVEGLDTLFIVRFLSTKAWIMPTGEMKKLGITVCGTGIGSCGELFVHLSTLNNKEAEN